METQRKIWGDYHTHTIFSHGKGTIEDNVREAARKGLLEVAITDHGFKHIYFGVKKREFPLMREEVGRLSKIYDIRILLGIESNLYATDGRTDVEPGQESALDVYLCGYHRIVRPADIKGFFRLNVKAALNELAFYTGKKQKTKNTALYIRTMEKNPVDVITHLDTGLKVEVLEVARAARDLGVLIELNEKHSSFTDEEIVKMTEEGVRFIINSDAHRPEKVGGVQTQLSLTERLKVPDKQIANLNKLPVFRSSSGRQ